MELGWVPLLLRQYCPHSRGRGIDFDDKREFWIRIYKEWGAGESLLEGVKCFFSCRCPGQRLGLSPEQASEGTEDATVVLDEPAVKVRKSEESLELFYSGGCWPGFDCFYLPLVHLNA